AATAPAEQAADRVVHARTGIVLSPAGGALGRLLPLLRLGIGGRLGPGTQYWSWITLRDQVDALRHLLTAPVHGAVNLCSPHPATNAEVTRALPRALPRPPVVPVPSGALRLLVGEAAADNLRPQPPLPTALEGTGFTLSDPQV